MTTQVQEKQAEDTLFGLTAKELANLHNWNPHYSTPSEAWIKNGLLCETFLYCTEYDNPRENDFNLGTMICGNRSCDYGDEQLTGEEEGCESMQDVEGWLIRERDAVICLPLAMYQHSGTSIYVGSSYDRWDGGLLGYIYTTRARICEMYGVKKVTKAIRERAEAELETEVSNYNAWINGMVYEYQVTLVSKCGECGDFEFEESDCGGGGYFDVDDAIEEANAEAERWAAKVIED